MADSIRVSLPTSGDEHEMGPPDEPGLIVTPGPGDTQHRPQKRRRIPVACGACRSKKSRVRLIAPPSAQIRLLFYGLVTVCWDQGFQYDMSERGREPQTNVAGSV